MKRIKRSYVIILTLLVLTVTFFGVSYAFFTSINEQHGKLNIVVGDLTYQLRSDDLDKNKLTVVAGSSKDITIKLTSLNMVNSKYELYYLIDDNSDVEIGYSSNTKDPVLGTIGAYEVKEITIAINNSGSSDAIIEFSVLGGLISNELVLNVGNSLNNELGVYEAYYIGDEITLVDGSKWHVLEDSGSGSKYVTLLSDYNLNSDGSYNTSCGRDIDGVYACNTIAFDPDGTNIYDETDSNNIGYFIKNIYEPLVLASLPGTTNVALPTASQIATADGQTFTGNTSLTTSWLITTYYWTRTSHHNLDNVVFYVANSKINNNVAYSTYYGARPTITTLKSNIVNTMSSTAELVIGTSVEAIDGSKWHVLEASGSDNEYVTLLSDYNLNSDGSYNTTCGVEINGEYECSMMAFDKDSTTIYDVNDTNNIGYFIKNAYNPLVTTTLPGTINITLPTAHQIAIADGKTYNSGNLELTSSWLGKTDYWTTTISTEYVLLVEESYIVDGYTSNNVEAGARPVITTLKTNLLAQ